MTSARKNITQKSVQILGAKGYWGCSWIVKLFTLLWNIFVIRKLAMLNRSLLHIAEITSNSKVDDGSARRSSTPTGLVFKNVRCLYCAVCRAGDKNQLCSLFWRNQVNHINIKFVQRLRHPIHNENLGHFLYLVLHKYVTLKNETLRGRGVDNKKGWIPLSPPPPPSLEPLDYQEVSLWFDPNRPTNKKEVTIW